MASDRLAKFDCDLCIQAVRRAHARGLPHGHVRNFTGHALLRAIRRYGRGLCIGTRALRNLCNLPVSRRRNGPALLDGRVVSCVRSVASAYRPVDACWAEISRYFAAGTAVWLISVLWRLGGAGTEGITTALLACLLGYRALVNAPVKGQIAAHASRSSGWITAALAVVPLVISLSAVGPVSQAAAGHEWQVFNLDALPGLIADGNTVFVDVTATWCLTCKVNDLRVLENAEGRSRLKQAHVIRMRADC